MSRCACSEVLLINQLGLPRRRAGADSMDRVYRWRAPRLWCYRWPGQRWVGQLISRYAMTTTVGSARHPSDPPLPDPRRWWALATVATAQLMVGIDLMIVNIALPSAQRSLSMSDPTRQWVITV